MQKIIRGLKMSAPLLAAALLASCNQPGSPVSRGSLPADSARTTADAIVYVNTDTLLAKYEFSRELQEELDNKRKEVEDRVKSRTTSFQNQVSSYQQKAATMTPSERQTTEQNLGRAQQELQALQQQAGQELMKNDQEANDKLHGKIQEFLREYARLNDFRFVLTYSRSNDAVLFADSTLDVTDEVLNGLNAAYAREKK